MSFREGELIARRYYVVNLIGTGSGGDVYKVWDKMRSTHLALKLLKSEWYSNPQLFANFLEEAKSLSNLQHPNIVRFYELVDNNDSAFFLMDYVDGVTLRSVIKESTPFLSHNKILSIITPVCKALNYAHQQNIIHCDIKPENIMIDQNGNVFLADFGISFTERNADNFLGTAGTPAYMAPEQILGSSVSPQTDIYALGIVLYELFTGMKPFQGKIVGSQQIDTERIKWEQVHMQPVPPTQINLRLVEGVNEVILKCLDKNPLLRYSDTIQLMHALEKIQIEERSISEDKKKTPELKEAQVSVSRKSLLPIIIITIVIGLIISMVFVMGQSEVNLRSDTIIQPENYYYQDACMVIQVQEDSVLEECVTSVSLMNDKNLRVNFRWKLINSSLNHGVSIAADTNNQNMYIVDNLGNRWDHVSTGGGTNQNVILNIGEYKEGWFIFPLLPPESSGFYFVDEDNQASTRLLEKEW